MLGSVDVCRERIDDIGDQVLVVFPNRDNSALALGWVLVHNELGGKATALGRVEMVVSTAVNKLARRILDDISDTT